MSTRSSRTSSARSTPAPNVYQKVVDEFLGDAAMRSARRAFAKGTKFPTRAEQEQQRKRAREMRIRMAGETAKRVEDFVRAPVMEKPEFLPSFLDIRKTLDRARASRREPNQQTKETIRDYNLWLDTCLAAEGRDVGTVTYLLDAMEVLEDAQAGNPMARVIEKHIRNAFGVELPDPVDWPPPGDVAKRASWIRRLVHREDVIPIWLMDGLEVPHGLDDDEPDDEPEESDDDDQSEMDFKD